MPLFEKELSPITHGQAVRFDPSGIPQDTNPILGAAQTAVGIGAEIYKESIFEDVRKEFQGLEESTFKELKGSLSTLDSSIDQGGITQTEHKIRRDELLRGFYNKYPHLSSEITTIAGQSKRAALPAMFNQQEQQIKRQAKEEADAAERGRKKLDSLGITYPAAADNTEINALMRNVEKKQDDIQERFQGDLGIALSGDYTEAGGKQLMSSMANTQSLGLDLTFVEFLEQNLTGTEEFNLRDEQGNPRNLNFLFREMSVEQKKFAESLLPQFKNVLRNQYDKMFGQRYSSETIEKETESINILLDTWTKALDPKETAVRAEAINDSRMALAKGQALTSPTAMNYAVIKSLWGEDALNFLMRADGLTPRGALDQVVGYMMDPEPGLLKDLGRFQGPQVVSETVKSGNRTSEKALDKAVNEPSEYIGNWPQRALDTYRSNSTFIADNPEQVPPQTIDETYKSVRKSLDNIKELDENTYNDLKGILEVTYPQQIDRITDGFSKHWNNSRMKLEAPSEENGYKISAEITGPSVGFASTDRDSRAVREIVNMLNNVINVRSDFNEGNRKANAHYVMQAFQGAVDTLGMGEQFYEGGLEDISEGGAPAHLREGKTLGEGVGDAFQKLKDFLVSPAGGEEIDVDELIRGAKEKTKGAKRGKTVYDKRVVAADREEVKQRILDLQASLLKASGLEAPYVPEGRTVAAGEVRREPASLTPEIIMEYLQNDPDASKNIKEQLDKMEF